MSHERYLDFVERSLKDPEMKPIFEEYKKYYGRYPAICMDASPKECLEFYKRDIENAKKEQK